MKRPRVTFPDYVQDGALRGMATLALFDVIMRYRESHPEDENICSAVNAAVELLALCDNDHPASDGVMAAIVAADEVVLLEIYCLIRDRMGLPADTRFAAWAWYHQLKQRDLYPVAIDRVRLRSSCINRDEMTMH